MSGPEQEKDAAELEAPSTAPPDDLDRYDGQWVAVRDGVVVAHAADEAALRAEPDLQDGDLVYPIGEPVSGFYLINV